MLPVKIKEFIEEESERVDIPADDLWDMINFYYHEVARACSALEHPRIEIKGLGFMKFKEYTLDDPKIRQYQLYDQGIKGLEQEMEKSGIPSFVKIVEALEEDKRKEEWIAENRKEGIYGEDYNLRRGIKINRELHYKKKKKRNK